MKKISLLFVFCITLLFTVSDAWSADDLEIINGGHWLSSTIEQKRAYLFGVGNMLEIEQAMAGDKFDNLRGISIVPVLLDGLSGISIADHVQNLDLYYAQHTKNENKTVIEVLYHMAKANLKK
jgi:hypothetical protein